MSKPVAYLGIDPGSCGCICLYVPGKKITFGDLYKQEPHVIAEGLKEIIAKYDVRMAMVEKVSAIPGAAAGSTFKFGYNIGMIHTILIVLGIPMDLVLPRVWQKELRTTEKGGVKLKKQVATLVHRLYPKAEIYGARGGLKDGRSDALGIAHYCFLKYK